MPDELLQLVEPKTPRAPHVGVVEQIHYQAPDAQPVAWEMRYGFTLTTDEQPYSRKLTISESWTPLDVGWLERSSMVFVVNEAGRYPRTIPTEAERAATEAKVIELGYGTADGVHCFAFVHPGRSARFEPADVKSLHVRCRSGEARLTVNVLPG